MRKLIRLILLSTAVFSCQKTFFDLPPRSHSGYPMPGRTGEAEELPTGPSVPDLYASAICLPADSTGGYDVLLFKNGTPVQRVHMDGEPDPERHRIWGGRLWTDECDGATMRICCDGQERFRYEGDERLRGFLETPEGNVYTLGQRQGREGLSLRLNGKELFRAPTGTILGSPYECEWEGGALAMDASGVFFAYGIPIGVEGKTLWEYHVMREGQLVQNIPAGSVQALYDIRVMDGVVYRCEQRGAALCLVEADTYRSLGLDEKEPHHLCKLFPLEGHMAVKGYSQVMPGLPTYRNWIRVGGEDLFVGYSAERPLHLRCDGVHTAFLEEGPGRSVERMVLDGEKLSLGAEKRPPGTREPPYTLSSARCFQLQKGMLGVALDRDSTARHLLLRGRDTLGVSFDGYFTSVQID